MEDFSREGDKVMQIADIYEWPSQQTDAFYPEVHANPSMCTLFRTNKIPDVISSRFLVVSCTTFVHDHRKQMLVEEGLLQPTPQ